MTKIDDLIDYNEVDDPIARIMETLSNAPNKGDEGSPDEDGCTFDKEQQEQHQSKYGDSIFYAPYVTKPPRGSVEDIQHKLRISGTRLRKSLNRSLNRDPQAWTALRRPASLHSAQRTLAEMLVGAVTIAPPLSYREKLSQKPHFWPIVFEKIISKTRQKPQYFCLLPRFLACFWQEGQGQTRVG